MELETILPLLSELSRDRTRRRSLESLAKQAGRSPSHFQRAFRRLAGESPKQFTLRLQLECAAVQLLTTSASVLEVALEVGFESHEGFTRAFTRHFSKPPAEFRKDAQTLVSAIRHAGFVEHVGPCVHLFRTNLKRTSAVNYDITRQPIPEITFLHKSARCPQSEIATALGQLLPAVFQYAMQNGIELLGPPMTIYAAWGPGMVTVQAGLAVKAGTRGTDEFSVAVLPEGPAAVTVHTGAYDGLTDAHAAVEVFVHEQGFEVSGPPREIYLTDPGEVPNPDDWKTQIVWPLADADLTAG